MDFFEAQARAKKRTFWLVVIFAFAVVSIIALGYFAAILSVHHFNPGAAYWEPSIFWAVAGWTVLVIGGATLYKWGQFAAGGAAVAKSVGARLVEPHTTDPDERRLLNVVEEMAIASGTPVPAVYIMDDERGINAFAAGLTPNDAVVAVTRGTLEKLDRDELQGVIGHEFSHILNGDMRLNLQLSGIIFGILAISLCGRMLLASLSNLRTTRSDSKGGNAAMGFVVAAFLVGLGMFILGYVGYIFGRLIQAAVSRQREFLADASAVQFTRNPAGIVGALKKIGGYALGSTVSSRRSEPIRHFFFAQGFSSHLEDPLNTHPPLEARIRAIDPKFDGKMFAPPEVVDVGRTSFADLGLGKKREEDEITFGIPSQPIVVTPGKPVAVSYSSRQSFGPEITINLLASAGSTSPAQLFQAQRLLYTTPRRLHAAAHSPQEAPFVLYGLLLAEDAEVRARQHAFVTARHGEESLRLLTQLEPELHNLPDDQKLPLVQLALPTLRQLPPSEATAMLTLLGKLIFADREVSPFEFALQKIVSHSLAASQNPGAAVVQIYSFKPVIGDISVVLSARARVSVGDPKFASKAFALGAAQIKVIQTNLRFLDAADSDLNALGVALDKLATASLPIKQRTMMAAAHVVNADGRVLPAELELLRAIAATLDVPMPLPDWAELVEER